MRSELYLCNKVWPGPKNANIGLIFMFACLALGRMRCKRSKSDPRNHRLMPILYMYMYVKVKLIAMFPKFASKHFIYLDIYSVFTSRNIGSRSLVWYFWLLLTSKLTSLQILSVIESFGTLIFLPGLPRYM